MKIKSNVRAGSGQNRNRGSDNPPGSEDPVYVPPVGRCAGV
jgi:hypothetical protein